MTIEGAKKFLDKHPNWRLPLAHYEDTTEFDLTAKILADFAAEAVKAEREKIGTALSEIKNIPIEVIKLSKELRGEK